MPFVKGHISTGGRPAGSVNKKNKSLREALSRHADGYFTAVLDSVDVRLSGSEQEITLHNVTRFEADMVSMDPKDRALLMERYVSYILPKLQATTLDMEIRNTPTIEDILIKLSAPQASDQEPTKALLN